MSERVNITEVLKEACRQNEQRRTRISGAVQASNDDAVLPSFYLDDFTQSEVELEILVAIDGWLQGGDDNEDIKRSLHLMQTDLGSKEKEATRLLKYDVHTVGLKHVQEVFRTLTTLRYALSFISRHLAQGTQWYRPIEEDKSCP